LFKIARGRINLWQVLGAVAFMTVQVITTLYLPNITSDIVNNGVSTGDTNYIIHAGTKMILISIVSVIAAVGNVLWRLKLHKVWERN